MRDDRRVGRMVVVGYLIGCAVVFGLMMALLTRCCPRSPDVAHVFAAAAVAFQAGIMGAIIDGPWSTHHMHELYH
jgi:hypothetical protein